MALWKNKTLYVTSTAVGPAFEGVEISCGCGSVPGAIDQVTVENGKMRIHTIGNMQVCGICGSGLVDAVAVMLDLNYIDEIGAAQRDELRLTKQIKLEQKENRSVQQAKAAIAAGISILLEETGVSLRQVETLYLARGFGRHLGIDSVVRIGLITSVLRDKVIVLGNASLSGACRLPTNQQEEERCRKIADESKHVSLGEIRGLMLSILRICFSRKKGFLVRNTK